MSTEARRVRGTLATLAVALALALALALSLSTGLAAAASRAELADAEAALELAALRTLGPWPPATPRDAGNPVSGRPDAIALGRRLFADRRLSGDGSLACIDCHQPAQALADGLPRSVGRVVLARHAPSLWNAGLQRWQGWDGAADSLWSQAIRPLLDAREMAATPTHVAKQIAADAELACRHRAVFGTPPDAGTPAAAERTLVQVAQAMGAWLATLVSGRTAFDDFRDARLRGDGPAEAAYPAAARRGLRLFIGEGGCTVCHGGPRLSHGEFADIGRPHFSAPGVVDRGREAGIDALRASPYTLTGPWAQHPPTNGSAAATAADPALTTRALRAQPRNLGEFRIPSLRNVAATPPYTHDGSVASLDDMLRHYADLDLERLHADGSELLRPLGWNAAQRADVIAFLRTLDDPAARRLPMPVEPEAVAGCGDRLTR
ncbi:cytochrome-c peroxidase [Sphaerotilus mobilis]|uniref:Cytochrome c peroxidase n=1 Tax=Sphaerotilus mobilis TaxID=47994 RepID=A0A4Q7LL27_9BURK|nr:cytochrome c peroxidase [Sphaerotilus mobilis]RZS54941.1 cytochrome c peroxidase [Sphaerotilus mobilis]